jgi:hypothetical protein
MWSDLAWSARFGGPAKPYFFFKFWIRAVIGNFPTATWQPLIGPCGSLPFDHVIHCSVSLPCQCHIIVWMPHHANHHAMSLPHHATSLYGPYGLPRGKILLVHGLVQKCQIWVTRGSLWCCHVTMLTST